MTDFSQNWGKAFALIRADFRRRLELEGRRVSIWNACRLLLKPGAFCVAAYRVSTWLHINHHPILSKIVDVFQYMFSGTEIHVGSVIGEGLVVADTRGIGLVKNVKIGKNCTILGASSMTLGGMDRVDPERDYIIIGDHCIVGVGTRILGPLTLADETQIKPNSVVVTSSLVAGAILSGIPARRRGNIPRGSLAGWNPLQPCTLARLHAPLPVKEVFP